jgi:hypothetical protein
LVATDYIETTTTTAQAGILEDMARLDYSGGLLRVLLFYLSLNGQPCLYSEQFDNAAWAKSNATVTANATTSPEGYVNAYKLITNNAVINGQITDNISKSASQITYTSSIFVKKAEWDRIGLYISDASTFNNRGQAFFNLDGTLGTVAAAGTFTNASSNIEEYPNDWYRVYLTVTVPSTTTTIVLRYYSLDNNELNGDGTSGIYIYGAQLEEGSLTSYIPTYGTSQTRSKDSCIKTGISSLIGQTEGTLFAEFEIPVNTQNGDIIAIRNGAGSANGIFVSYRSSSVVQLIVRTSSTNALIFQRIGSYPSGKNKIAVAYKNGDFAISLNGTAAQVNTSSITMPTSLDSVALFGDNLYAQTLPVPYAPVLLFKTRLTNAKLADLTTI